MWICVCVFCVFAGIAFGTLPAKTHKKTPLFNCLTWSTFTVFSRVAHLKLKINSVSFVTFKNHIFSLFQLYLLPPSILDPWCFCVFSDLKKQGSWVIGFAGRFCDWRIEGGVKSSQKKSWTNGWWFQILYMFIPIWGRFPFWLIFFRWVGSTTNQTSVSSCSWEVNQYTNLHSIRHFYRRQFRDIYIYTRICCFTGIYPWFVSFPMDPGIQCLFLPTWTVSNHCLTLFGTPATQW